MTLAALVPNPHDEGLGAGGWGYIACINGVVPVLRLSRNSLLLREE